jgi:hypothetical protein
MNARRDRGFAGLETLVSDITADIAEAERLGRVHRAPATPPAVPKPTVPGTPLPDGGMSAPAKWAVGVGAALVVVWLLAALGGQPDEPPADIPAAQTAPAPTPVPTAFEVKPPAEENRVLTVGEIRYCLAEDIRLDAIDPLVDTTSAREVNRFNARVHDYNSRCARSRYARDAFERARRDVEARRATIENGARAQWKAGK